MNGCVMNQLLMQSGSRYSTGVAARMVKILNDSDAELTARLLVALDSLDPGSFTVTRLESLLASVREVNALLLTACLPVSPES
ncbi:hypothetical protein EH64_23210 [Escherichia coli]|nr:hypothetical protein EH64_23210 [Escherichia coli]